MKLTGPILLAALVVLAALPAAAQRLPCGSPYIVQRGDSLSTIADAAYGNAGNYQLIYSANARVIGPNPAVVAVGQPLQIPCLNAPVTVQDAVAAVLADDTPKPQPEPAAVQLPAPDVARRIRFVTATDWAPYTNQDQDQGGMLTEVIDVAMGKVRQGDEYKIDFINDWSAHLNPLVADNAYDFGFPWFRPNCDLVEKLGPESQFRCRNLDWSDALFEVIVGWYTLPDVTPPARHGDLSGMTICRPQGYALFMLEERDLVEPAIRLMRERGPADCFQALMQGRADAVVLAVDVADDALLALNARDRVVRHDALDTVSTLHAVTSKTNPNGKANLAVLDAGIGRIKDSGEWFSIVRRHLAAHKARQ